MMGGGYKLNDLKHEFSDLQIIFDIYQAFMKKHRF